MLRFREVNKSYKDNVVLNNVSFDIENGRIVGLIGENGAGKSTIISLISGEKTYESGEVAVDDQYVDDYKNYFKRVAFVFDNEQLYSNLTGIQNLRMYTDDEEKLRELLMIFGMYEHRNLKTKLYSLGMKQKINIIRALLQWNSLLVMDEPFNGLDFETVLTLKKYIKGSLEENRSVLVTSHSLKEMLSFCDQYLFLIKQEKKVICVDAKAIKDFYKFDSYFLGNMKENIKELEDKHISYLSIPEINKVYFRNEKDLHIEDLRHLDQDINILEDIQMSLKKGV